MISHYFTITLLIATLLNCPFQCLKKATDGLQKSVEVESCSCCSPYHSQHRMTQDSAPVDHHQSNREPSDCICKGALVQILSESAEIYFTLHSCCCFAAESQIYDPLDLNLHQAENVQLTAPHFPLIRSGRDLCALISLRLI